MKKKKGKKRDFMTKVASPNSLPFLPTAFPESFPFLALLLPFPSLPFPSFPFLASCSSSRLQRNSYQLWVMCSFSLFTFSSVSYMLVSLCCRSNCHMDLLHVELPSYVSRDICVGFQLEGEKHWLVVRVSELVRWLVDYS